MLLIGCLMGSAGALKAGMLIGCWLDVSGMLDCTVVQS